MSTMLEQAIIDAAALRETAMKSAEASLIEKYSKEFKESVEKLLEQEMEPEAAAANAADPTGPTVTPQQTPAVDPSQALEADGTPKKDPFKKVKSAFFDLDGDDDELITINFDKLRVKPVDQSSMLSQPSQPATLLAPEPTPAPAEAPQEQPASLEESLELDLDYDEINERLVVRMGEQFGRRGGDSYNTQAEEEEEEEYEFEEEELDEGSKESNQAAETADRSAAKKREEAAVEANKAQKFRARAKEEEEQENKKAGAGSKSASPAPSSSSDMQEEIQLTEDELLELEESLKVEMENVPDGYMGSTKRKERESKKVAYAAARGDKQRKRRELAKEKLSDLQEALEHVAELYTLEKQENKSLKETNENMMIVVNNLKEQLEKINLSNAKLLYTNKVLSNVSLNERQKNTVVENITKAQSVLEAKTIYETLQSNVQSVKTNTPKSLSEALNRGPSPFLVRKTQTAGINDLMSERMKLLAGIKN